MALKKFIFPLDLRGDRASNRVEENHTIGTQQYRAFALKNGPFYTKDLAIRERNTGRVLQRGDDYECVFFYEDLTALTPGKEICGVIVVHNTAISTDITVNANIVGGPFAQSAEAIKEAIDALEINNKNTYWQNVIDKPDLFQPTPHMHDFGDIFGLEFMIDVLGHIRDTLLIGDNAQFEQVRERIDALEQQLRQLHQEHLDDTDNPHRTTAEQVNCYDKQAIDNFLQGINQDFADLEPRLRSLVNGISDINDRIDGLVQALNNTNLQLNQNAQSLSRVHQQIAEINTGIDDLNDHINRIDNEITGLKQRDVELTGLIDKNREAIEAEKGRNDTQDNEIEDLKSKDNEHDTELARLKKVDETHTSGINAVNERARLVEEVNTAQQGTLNDHGTRLGSVETRVTNLERNPPTLKWGSVQITGYVNSMDGILDWTCPDGSVMVGAYSYHNNGTEDRRWRFRYRSLTIQEGVV